MRIAFIGGGVMAEAIIAGIRNAEIAAGIVVGEPVKARRDALSKYRAETTDDNKRAVEGADIVVLSVKPQQFDHAAPQLKGVLSPDQTVLSIMAGVKMHSIGLKLSHRRLVRVMPNTPAQVGQGMSVWTASPEVPVAHLDFTQKMLSSIGDEVRVGEEKYVDMATALSASGPAYVFLFIESLTDAGVLLGMPQDVARRLAVKTVLGSAALAQKSGRHPAELRNSVTSPGGTTAAALLALEEGGFRAAVVKAVKAAYQRGEELGASTK
jgi:pyrroline-5-carboxylate reductase